MQKGWFDKYFTAIKVMIMLCAYGYLVYMLVTFKHYDQLPAVWNHLSAHRWGYLAAAVVLWLANWGIETCKWQTLLTQLQPLPFLSSLKSVFIGITTGFFTPNRIGETAGRALLLQDGNRIQGMTLTLVGAVAQNFTSLLFGFFAIMGTVLWELNTDKLQYTALAVIIGCFIGFASLYFTLPLWGKRLLHITWLKKITPYVQAALSIPYSTLIKVTLLSMVRYVVYCLQFYLLLLFFGVQLAPNMALILIPLHYLAVSFTPSIAFSEVGIRGAFAGFIIGGVGAVLASISVWCLNYVFSMMVGSILLLCTKKTINVKQ